MTTKLRERCPFCGNRVEVMAGGAGFSAWLKRHRMGRGADIKGGQTPRTTCIGSHLSHSAAVAENARLSAKKEILA